MLVDRTLEALWVKFWGYPEWDDFEDMRVFDDFTIPEYEDLKKDINAICKRKYQDGLLDRLIDWFITDAFIGSPKIHHNAIIMGLEADLDVSVNMAVGMTIKKCHDKHMEFLREEQIKHTGGQIYGRPH